jgi:hypothetical protein
MLENGFRQGTRKQPHCLKKCLGGINYDGSETVDYTSLTSKIGAHAPTPLHPLRLEPG